jgi:uncharacterized membrane protein|tara:strand:- start:3243 stop:3575 length:333 start_codon:yes stop_codon:yes gene_type:complete
MKDVSENQVTDISNKEVYIILSVAAVVTALIYLFFIHSLLPSFSFFEGFGRIAIIWVINGIIIWIGYTFFRPKLPIVLKEIIFGILLASFFGCILGLLLAAITDYFGLSF